MRAKALEKVGETRKRVVGDDVSEGPEKKGEKNKEIWNRNHSISEEEVGKRIQNQTRRVRTKEAGAMCTSKVARRNDTATDPSTGAAATSAASTAIMQQKQQQNQALVAVLQELAKKK